MIVLLGISFIVMNMVHGRNCSGLIINQFTNIKITDIALQKRVNLALY